MKIGIGYDIHRLEAGKQLIIGGIIIPYKFGLVGHSDADVLVHSICDAILGAGNLGDIGEHFPDNDLKYKNICSLKLLKMSYKMIKDNNLRIQNLDTIIFAEKPLISPYKTKIQENIAKNIKINKNQINIKASTTEKLGAIGQGKGIASMCIALLT